MAGYCKSWVDKRNKAWYVSLSLTERGVRDQLRDMASIHGETGKIFLRNWTQVGTELGCDRKTAGRIVGKLAENSHISLTESEDGIGIIILDYEYRQRVMTVEDTLESGDRGENSPLNRTEQTRTEQNKGKQKKKRKKVPETSFRDWADVNQDSIENMRVTYELTIGQVNRELAKAKLWADENRPLSNRWGQFLRTWLGKVEPDRSDEMFLPNGVPIL